MLFREGGDPNASHGPAGSSEGNNSTTNPAKQFVDSFLGLVLDDGDRDDESHHRRLLLSNFCEDDDGEEAQNDLHQHTTRSQLFSDDVDDGNSSRSSYISATSTAAQSFNQRMALLSDERGCQNATPTPTNNGNSDHHSLLATSRPLPFNLFPSITEAADGSDRLYFASEASDNTRDPNGSHVPATGSPTSSYTALSERVATAPLPTSHPLLANERHQLSSQPGNPGGRDGRRPNSPSSPSSNDRDGEGKRTDDTPPLPPHMQQQQQQQHQQQTGSGGFTVHGSSGAHSNSRPVPSQHPFSFPGIRFYPYPTPEYFASRRLGNATAAVTAPACEGFKAAHSLDHEGRQPVDDVRGEEDRATDRSESPSTAKGDHKGSFAGGSPQGGGGGGAKLFLGGLRFEVIQAGRHVVSWLFECACGVHLSPNAILIHRRSKNAASNSSSAGSGHVKGGGIAPTGCASVFVADEEELAQLLAMNQRMFCASAGLYVAESVEQMKGLLATAGPAILDILDGRARGPTHPIVVERANSGGTINNQGRNRSHHTGGSGSSSGPAHHHLHQSCGSASSRGTFSMSSSNSDFVGSGSGAFLYHHHDHAVGGGGNPMNPAAGGPPPPPYAAASGTATPTLLAVSTPASSGYVTPPATGYALGPFPPPSSHSFGLTPTASTMAQSSTAANLANLTHHHNASGNAMALPGTQPPVDATMAAAMLELLQQQQQQQQQQQAFGANLGSLAGTSGGALGNPFFFSNPSSSSSPSATQPTAAAPPMAQSHLSFHVYPGDAAVEEAFAQRESSSSASAEVFLGGLPLEASAQYVSWVLAIAGVQVSPRQVRKLGGYPSAHPAIDGHTGGVVNSAKSCAAACLRTPEDLALLLTFRDRLLPTRRGVWVGKAPATITALLLEDPSLADCAPLYIERRNASSQGTGSSVNGQNITAMPGTLAPPPPPPPPPPPLPQGFPLLPPFSGLGGSLLPPPYGSNGGNSTSNSASHHAGAHGGFAASPSAPGGRPFHP